MKNFKETGITLIALVVTIIILLILAGVTIGFAINGSGLFDKAKTATEEYNNKAEEERIALSKYENDIDTYVNGADRQENLSTRMKFFGDYTDPAVSTKVATYDEIKDYSLFIVSGYYSKTAGNKAVSTTFTLEELMNCSSSGVGHAFLNATSYVDVSYNSTEKAVYLNATGLYGRLMGIK